MPENIKKYNNVNKNPSVTFRISRMEEIYSERNGKSDNPHTHDFYTVLLVKKAIGVHMIDFKEHPLSENQVFFVHPGQVHQVKEKSQPSGYVLLFSDEFLVKNNISSIFIENLNLFNEYGSSPPLHVDEYTYNKLSTICNELIDLTESETRFFDQAIGANLQLFLIRCNNLCDRDTKNLQELEAGNSILRNYKQLINEKFNTWHLTSDYAKELNVSADHLNKVVKTLTGKTAKELIQARIIIQAKRLLYFSQLSAKEIGYELGFLEPANFSSFFKKCTHISPSQYKTEAKTGFS